MALLSLVAVLVVGASGSRADATPAPARLIDDDVLNGFIQPVDTLPTDLPVPTGIFQVPAGDEGAAMINALHDLEDQAVTDTVDDHQLLASDTAAAQTWGRHAAIAELWGLLLKAVQTPDGQKTIDQAYAAEWLASVSKKESEIEAYYTGLEFVKYAGLNKATYDADVRAAVHETDPSLQAADWSTVLSFLEGRPVPGTNDGTHRGYCFYQSPGTEDPYDPNPAYCSPVNSSCYAAGTCDPPPNPGIGDLATWGIDDSYGELTHDVSPLQLLVTREFDYGPAAGSTLAQSLVGPAFGSGAGAVRDQVLDSLHGFNAPIPEDVETGIAASEAALDTIAAVVAIVNVAALECLPCELALDVIEAGVDVGIAIYNEVRSNSVPGDLVGLLEHPAADVSALAASNNGRAALFTMFLASTLPEPTTTDCGIVHGGVFCPPVLNAPPIVAADTPFLIPPADGIGPFQSSNQIAFYDFTNHSQHVVNLNHGWFVDHTTLSDKTEFTTQSLDITYTDWNGNERTAWVIPSGAGGYEFATSDHIHLWFAPEACFVGHCGVASQINYEDAAGDQFEAYLSFGNEASEVPPVPSCTGSCGPSSTTTTRLTWSPLFPRTGGNVVLSAAVARNCQAGPSCPVPTGTVSFVERKPGFSRVLCNSAVNDGVATCNWSEAASIQIVATFLPTDTGLPAGTGGTAGSQEENFLQTTTLAPSTTSLALSTGPVSLGATVNAVANVTSTANPFDGLGAGVTVTFLADGKPVCNNVRSSGFTDNTWDFYCSTSFATAGKHAIVASFSGGARDVPSEGTASVTVTPGPPHLQIVPVGPLVAGHATPIQLRVSADGVPSAAITGGIQLSEVNNNSVHLTSCTVSAGTATCSATPSSAGAETLGAVFTYGGDPQYGDLSATAHADETVNDPAVTVTVFGGERAGAQPSFGYKASGPGFLSLTGSLTCTSSTGGPLSSLLPGTYTLDPMSCSGLSLGGNGASAFHIVYAGANNGFRVYVNTAASYIVTVTGSQVHAGQPTFSYVVDQVPVGTDGTGDLTGSVTCTGVDGGRNNLDSSLFHGQYQLTSALCSGLSNAEGAPIQYNGGTFTVTPEPVTATVTGAQTYGGADLRFFARSDVETGSVSCTTVNGGTPITPTMDVAPGPYVIDGEHCSGLSTFGGNWKISYVGRFTVAPLPVTVFQSGSQTFGQQPSFTYSTSRTDVHLGGQLTCTNVGGTPITPTLAPNTYGQLVGCSGLSAAGGDYNIQYNAGDTARFTVSPERVNVGVTGAQTVGVGTPRFSYDTAQTIAAGSSLDGTVTCASANGQPTYPPSLPVGTYTLDSGSCSGLVAEPTNAYAITYVGGTFTVNPVATVSPATAPPAFVGVPWTATFHVTGGTPPYTIATGPDEFNAEGTGIVPTITWDPATATETFTGTATGTGRAFLDVRGQDASGAEIDLINVAVDVLPARQSQAIMVTTHAPSAAVFGTTFTVAATGGDSGNPVTFSSSGVCSNSDGTFTMTSGTGICMVRYDQAGSGTYDPAPQVAESVTALKAGQAITVDTHAPASAVSGTSFGVAAHAPGGVVSFSSSGACSNSGSTFTITSDIGTCTVMYDQAGNDNYDAAPKVTESVSAQKASQAITVTTHAPSTAVYGTSFTVAATGGESGNPVTYSSAGACSNSGSTFTMTSGTGTCIVKYDQAGNDNYNAAPEVTESVTAQNESQAITVTTHAPGSAVFGTSFTVAATGGGSGNPVTFSSAGACSNSGATFTMTSGSGTCTVKYDQAGNAGYDAAPEVTESVTAQKASQAISVDTHAPASAVFGASFGVAAHAPGGVVSFSSSGACSNSGSTFTMTSGTGTCTVKYDQAGNDNYDAAPEVAESVNAEKASQVITFTSSPVSPALVGDSYTPTATGGASSNLVVFSIDASSSPGACVLMNGTVSFIGVGTCIVDANQDGDANHLAATQLQQTITVSVTESVSGNVHGSLTVSAGQAVLVSAGAHVSGGVNVDAGGSLTVQRARISGGLTASGAALIRVCDSTVSGPVSITGTTGPVVMGDDDGPTACAGSRISGGVTMTGNSSGVEFDGNTVSGPLTITGNTGTLAPPDSGTVDAVGNKVSGPVKIQP